MYDPYSIDYLFADQCLCGADKGDDAVFCPECRASHENLLSRALASVPQQANLPECHNCKGAHPTYRCPEIAAALRSDNRCCSCDDPAVDALCRACMEAGEEMDLLSQHNIITCLALGIVTPEQVLERRAA